MVPTLVNKRFFFRDLYQTLVSCGVPVEPRPHQNLLVISGTAVRTRSAETRRDRSGSTYWLVRHCLCEALGERPWLLVLRGDESPIATHYYLLSPEEQTTFDGDIGSNVSGQESLYAARRPTELIGHLRSLASS